MLGHMDLQDEQPTTRADEGETGGQVTATDEGATVEGLVREHLAEQFGGPRGFMESAAPIAAFGLVYVVADGLQAAAVAGVATAVLLLLVRVVQRSTLRFVGHGLVGIVIAAAIALATGRAETAFLPGLLQAGAWAAGLGLSMLVRRPAAGYVIGAILSDPTGWRDHPAIVRLSNRLTLVLLVPMVLRVAVQLPLYLAAEVGWLAVARVALGWPLTLATLAVAGALLARGRTPLHDRRDPSGEKA